MKFEIDTKNKTITISSNLPLNELMEFMKHIPNCDEYTIQPKGEKAIPRHPENPYTSKPLIQQFDANPFAEKLKNM